MPDGDLILAAPGVAKGTTEVLLMIISILGAMIGVLVGWWLRGRGGIDESSEVETDGVDWGLRSSGDRHLGFILAVQGAAPRPSDGIAGVLAGVPEGEAVPPPCSDIETWAAGVDPDDRIELASMLRFDPENQLRLIQIRVHRPAHAGDDGSAASSAVRWFEVRWSSPREGHVELLLVEETNKVDSERQRMVQLRNQRLLARVAEIVPLAEDFAEAVAELLPVVGEGMNLRNTGWYRACSASDGMAWEVQASWRSEGGSPIPARLIDLDESTRDALDRGSAVLGPSAHPELLLQPVMVNDRTGAVLVLQSHGPNHWDEDSLDTIGRLGEVLGRRCEKDIIDDERETWAATRGAFERSEAIAQLTGGVAHDFNGVLFAVLGRCELLRSRVTDRDDIAELDAILETLLEAKRLGDRLRQALRPAGEPLAHNVSIELEEIVISARRLMPKRLHFEFNLVGLSQADDPIELVARINDLQRIIFNLLVNARDAVDSHGRIQLGARVLDGNWLEIRIDDDGPGIPADDRSRMLEPYETGNESDGVGLGLSVAQRTAEEIGGSLQLEESPLGGLGVKVLLPIRIDAAATSVDEVGDEKPGMGAVLVIEDNPVIRDVLVRVLEGLGAEVTALGHAVGVESHFGDDSPFAMMIFDIDLPERTGIDCLRDLRASGIETPCLLITGGTTETPMISGSELLRKPFRIEELRQAVARLVPVNPGFKAR